MTAIRKKTSARERQEKRAAQLHAERILIGGGVAGHRDSLRDMVCGVEWLEGENGWHGRIGAAIVDHLVAGGKFVQDDTPETAYEFIKAVRTAGVVQYSGQEDYLLDCLTAFINEDRGGKSSV